jgi:hypothetical protein
MTRGTLLLACLLGLLTAAPLAAADIVIDDSRCSLLKGEDLAALVKRLQDARAIGPDDKVVCSAGASSSISDVNINIGNLLSAIGAGICEVKSLIERAKCAEMTNDSQAATCRRAESDRYSAIRSVCQ